MKFRHSILATVLSQSFSACALMSCAGDYQAGARGSFNTAAAAADGFHSNQPAATCSYGSAPVCRSEGRSHDLHVGPETGRRGHGCDKWKGPSVRVYQ